MLIDYLAAEVPSTAICQHDWHLFASEPLCCCLRLALFCERPGLKPLLLARRLSEMF